MKALPSTRAIDHGLAVVLGCLVVSCEVERTRPGWEGPLPARSAVPNANLGIGYQQDGGKNEVPCTPTFPGARPHEAGNYDNRSCNSAGCHITMIGGGWVYTNPNGVPWLDGATVTISNADGSTVTARSAADGFFQITSPVVPPYKVCVSECPSTNCSLLPHPNSDCQTSRCHGERGQRIYVSLDRGDAPDPGGPTPVDSGTQNCSAPAKGGPYTHSEWVYGTMPCSGRGCHRAEPVFNGGFLYDGPLSTTTVPEATITLIPSSGAPIETVTGVDGMFFFGTVSANSVPTPLTAPYTACVSKCPLTICSVTNGHKTTGDCQTSNCHSSDLKVYLR